MSSKSCLAALTLCALAVLPISEAFLSRKTLEGETEHCYALDHNPYLGFASKTSYEEVYNKEGIAPVKGCKAKQMWMVIRHGTRYPGEENLPDFDVSKTLKEQVLANHKKQKGSLCEEDLEALRNYDMVLDPKMANHLSIQGQQDLYNLGQRVRRSFPEIFAGKSYTHEEFQFRYTPTPRTKESAEYFYRGVFGLSFQADAQPLPDPIKNLIYAYYNCPGWEKESAKNKVHRANFVKSEHMKKVISSVSRRLGFDEDLSLDNLKIIYNDCRFYEAWNVIRTSPWCAAFTKQELVTLEYMEDLNYYYKSGPGHPWNLRLACPLVKDMYDHFSETAAKTNEKVGNPRAMFYFSHSTMLNQLSAGLGLRDDDSPITEDNFPQKGQNRNYRTSRIIPFTANILAVQYKCKSGPPVRTVFYQAEHKVDYPGCTDGICDWEYIEQKFAPLVNDDLCTDHSFCTSEITKPKSAKEMAKTAVKYTTAFYIGTIAILSGIIFFPMLSNAFTAGRT